MNEKPIDGVHPTTSPESLEQTPPQEESIKLPGNSLRIDKIGTSELLKSEHAKHCDPHNVKIPNPHSAAILDPQQMMDISKLANSFVREKIKLKVPEIKMKLQKIDPEMLKKLVSGIHNGTALIAHLNKENKFAFIHHLNIGNFKPEEIHAHLLLQGATIFDMISQKRYVSGPSAIKQEHLHNADLPAELKNKLINMKFEDVEHAPESWAQFANAFKEALEAHYAEQTPEEDLKSKKTGTQSTTKTLDSGRFHPLSSSKESSVQKTSLLSSTAIFTLGNILLTSSRRAERSRAKEQEENKVKMKEIEKREILNEEIDHTEKKRSIHHHDVQRIEERNEDTGIPKSPPST